MYSVVYICKYCPVNAQLTSTIPKWLSDWLSLPRWDSFRTGLYRSNHIAPCKEIQAGAHGLLIQDSLGFHSLVGFRIPWAVLRIPKPRIPDSITKNFPDSGIPYMRRNHNTQHSMRPKRSDSFASFERIERRCAARVQHSVPCFGVIVSLIFVA